MKIKLTEAQKELVNAIDKTFSDPKKTQVIVAGKVTNQVKRLHEYLEPTITPLSYQARKEYVIRALSDSMNELNVNNVEQSDEYYDSDDAVPEGLFNYFPTLKNAVLIQPNEIKRYAKIDPVTFEDLA